MGIQLTSIVEGKEITIEELFDKKIAVDAFNWLYQFLSIIRQFDGEPLKDSKGRITSHLSGLFYRNIKLLEAGIRPVYIFDGEAPKFKHATSEARRDVRAEAAKEWKEALERQDYEAAKKHAQRAVTINEEVIEGSKGLLEALGIPWMQAPSEGEALCSYMAKKGDVFAVATQDYDSLPFGAPRLIRNLSITGKKKRGDKTVTINPEMLVLEDVLEKLGINRDQLIILSILVGTDYNPGGVAGYGPKKALELVKEKRTLEETMKDLVWTFEPTAEEIFDFFRHPKPADYEIEFRPINLEAVKKLLCDEHDFSEERVDNAIKKITEKKDGQKGLGRFF
jgi:flap endonuclease-1